MTAKNQDERKSVWEDLCPAVIGHNRLIVNENMFRNSQSIVYVFLDKRRPYRHFPAGEIAVKRHQKEPVLLWTRPLSSIIRSPCLLGF